MEEISAGQAMLIESAMAEEAFLVRPRFERGCRCFAVVIDGWIAGYGWLSTRPEWIGELQLEISPGPDEAYIWNCVTVAEHRRKGIFRALLVGISALCRQEGLKRLWIGSVAIPAEKAVGPAGFRPALRFASATLAGLQVMLVGEVDRSLAAAGLRIMNTRSGIHVRRSIARLH